MMCFAFGNITHDILSLEFYNLAFVFPLRRTKTSCNNQNCQIPIHAELQYKHSPIDVTATHSATGDHWNQAAMLVLHTASVMFSKRFATTHPWQESRTSDYTVPLLS